MFLLVACQHASGMCQSHFCPVLSLRKVPQKYVELSPNTLPLLTLRFCKKYLTPTPNLLQIRPIPPPLGHILSRPKILRGFPTMNRFTKIQIFPRFPTIFRGPKKFSKRRFPRGFLGFWRTGLSKIIWNLDFPKFFSRFWRDRPTQKISEPTNLSAVFSGF